MQTFKEFIDYKKLSPEIKFERTMDGYAYNFGDGYKVEFINEPISIFLRDANGKVNKVHTIVEEENAYNIGFHYNFEYGFTGKNNEFFVYSRVISAIRKFITTFKPDGLLFLAAEQRMAILYDKFYKYLTNYIRIDEDKFISKSFYNSMPLDQKLIVDNYMQGSLPLAKANVKMLKQIHNNSRPINQQ